MSVKVVNIQKQLLSDNWYVLNKYAYDLERNNGEWVHQEREVYDRGDGATILLYNRRKGTVILINQFRMPTYVNGNESGMLLETCAGLLDADSPEECIRREAVEETGYQVGDVEKLFAAYMSPGGLPSWFISLPQNISLNSVSMPEAVLTTKISMLSSCRSVKPSQ